MASALGLEIWVPSMFLGFRLEGLGFGAQRLGSRAFVGAGLLM